MQLGVGGREGGRRNSWNFCVCSIYFVWDSTSIESSIESDRLWTQNTENMQFFYWGLVIKICVSYAALMQFVSLLLDTPCHCIRLWLNLLLFIEFVNHQFLNLKFTIEESRLTGNLELVYIMQSFENFIRNGYWSPLLSVTSSDTEFSIELVRVGGKFFPDQLFITSRGKPKFVHWFNSKGFQCDL